MCFPLMASLVEEWKLGTELHVKKRKEIYSDTWHSTSGNHFQVLL